MEGQTDAHEVINSYLDERVALLHTIAIWELQLFLEFSPYYALSSAAKHAPYFL